MLNGEVLGQKFYAARNAPFTRLGKAGKPMIGLRRNGQKPGPLGIGGQAVIRRALATTAIGNYGRYYGKDARGMPNISDAMAQGFPSNLRKTPEAKLQYRREKAAEAHASATARWQGAGGGFPTVPITGQGYGGFGPVAPRYP